jgi:mediator of RNA polymerase II transcription subunit 13
MLLPTSFLDISRSLPLPAGTPITLLPYGTPAYYLASYTGPTASLIKQFQASLQGMGAGQWESTPSNSYPYPAADSPSDGSPQTPTFIIGWIKVENKQGEDKGITIIYPTRLCLSYIPCSSSRVPLDYIPELPAPLQPSPQVAPAMPSLSNVSQGPGTFVASAYARANGVPILASPTAESLHSFRALTLSKTNDLRQVASEVGGYVDAVARERERERERLKREREYGASTSPKMARTTATTPASASAPTPAAVDASASASAPSATLPSAAGLPPYAHGQPSANAVAGPSTQSGQPTLTAAAQPQMATAISMQNFYPSPPHMTPHTAGVPDSTGPTSPAVDDATASTPAAAALSSIATDAISELTSVPSQPPSASTVVPPHMHAAAGAPGPSSYDMYGMDGAGGSSAYLGLDMDMDMDFGMGDLGLSFGMGMGMGMGGMDGLGGMDGISTMDTTPSVGNAGRSSGVGGGGGGMSMEFEDAFTDDDFSFFDRPARPAAAPPAPTNFAVHSRTTMSPAGPHFGGGGPGPPPTTMHTATAQNAQMFTPGGFGDGMSPHEGGEAADVRTPECAAGLGLGTLSAPATPGVHLSSGAAHAHPRFHAPASPASRFEPIPFAPYHRRADGKYAVGKFAVGVGLPSPPASEEDALEFGVGGVRGPGSLPASPGHGGLAQQYHYQYQGRDGSGNGTGIGGWRLRYDAATDPRIGVVRQLIGVKRKPRLAQGARDPQRTAPWVSTGSSTGGAACEEWETPLFLDAHGSTTGAPADAASEAESDEEEEDGEGDDDPATPLLSRPATPPPAYLPLGPTLLHTQFQHAALLPLSAPLRPPGASVLPAAELEMGVGAGMGLAPPPPLSVPTPVSPAATMGAASEKSKSLESAAHVVGVEVVENPVWAETWRAASAVSGAVRRRAEIWPGDCRAVEGLLGSVRGLQGGMSLAEVFGLGMCFF